MAITKNDIKIFQAQDNTDNNSGGGSRTNVEIQDGAVNNLFPDISRIDTVAGDVGLRKIFPTVFTENNDVYYGAHLVIRKTPTDPKVSSLLFHTDNPTDRRIDAQDMIESYVTLSYKEEFYLYGNHVSGARVVTFLQRLEALPPNVGEVYLIREDETTEQYVRVVSTEENEVTLGYSNGGSTLDYKRRRIICEIDQPLEHNFIGSEFHPAGQLDGTATTYATQVSDASKFFGVKNLSVAGSVGDTSIKVDSIYEQLVPAAKSQSFLVNQQALQQGIGLIPTGNVVSRNIGSFTAGVPFSIGSPVVPNSLTKLYQTTYGDDGLGNIVNKNTNEIKGSIEYETGIVTLDFGVSGVIGVTYEIANAFDSAIQFTSGIKITTANQGNSYIFNLAPSPSVGDLYVDYRAQGKWYRLSSNLDGSIGTDPKVGSGSVLTNGNGTSSVAITTGALPDIDSTIVISWGSSERLTDRLDLANTLSEFTMEIDLGQKNIDPTSYSMVAYSPAHSSDKTITCDADGILSDTANTINGRLDFINGILRIKDTLNNTRFDDPDSGRNVTIDYNYAGEATGTSGEIKTVVASRTSTGSQVPFLTEDSEAGTLSFNIGESVQVSGIRLEFKLFSKGTQFREYKGGRTVNLISDATGTFRLAGANKDDNVSWGTVTAAGLVSLTFADLEYRGYYPPDVGFGASNPFSSGTSKSRLFATDWNDRDQITVTYRTGDPASFPFTANIVSPMENLAVYKISGVENISGEIDLTLLKNISTDKTFNIFSKDGIVYNNVNNSGVGIQIGIIDYTSGEIELEYFNRPEDFYFNYNKIFADELGDDLPVSLMTFKTASTNLTSASLILSYETENGTYTGQTIDANGEFLPPATDIDVANSYVDTETGMVSVQFSANVIPSSIRYDAVAETSLPLDPELLGLNPVRLPSDGRVPVFKEAYIIVIFHEQDTAITGTPIADQVVNLSRSGQAYIEVVDAEGFRLDPDQYVADRDAGTVTFANPLVLEDKYGTALTAPFKVVDRIEDMVSANSVEINGLIKLVSPLTKDFPADETKVASALVWNNVGSRVYGLFHQELWNSGSPVWSDDLIGDTTTSKYDDVNYPITIDNKSSTSGRWAIIFTNSNTVKVAHEKLGVVEDSISIGVDDVAPVNPATGSPYFVMNRLGFGTGWVTNNVIRFNTDSGDANAWVIRTVQAGALSELTDNIEIEVRGDAN